MPAASSTRVLHVNGIDLAITEQGSGAPVILCHGFPGLGYSWRHQISAIAEAGWHAVAPDMRGYGRSSRPTDASAYDRATTVADIEGLLDALHADQAVFAGHDFGANLVWDLARWLPDRVAGLIQLSVPLTPRAPIRPSDINTMLADKHFFHMHYFQQPGIAERELDSNVDEFLRRIFWALSDVDRYLTCWDHPSAGNGYLDVLPPAPPLPWPWFSAAEFDHYVAEFSRSGFTGGLNWYRAADLVWEQNADLADTPIHTPTLFVAGDRDPVLGMMGRDPLGSMAQLVPGLRHVEMVPGAGHFVQMQEPARVNAAILDFLGEL
ncbi:alpha/beta fold hydrolase [Gordonia sp. SID5947]|uniref:alpha/beta fold hydrolase n=1 Tax=Gordonia sp. SID5947 TaxID=2690315 RepID=UPI0013719A6D|nr:alpha/beta hydrolase [Gordonia sp. SID5947]MYR07735.1 alpha/beta fold hydrolase [Gordonia sp. SID5947]